ncbi:MAG: ankyrin repeat domain-containing protein, partial [Leptospiraceae bacterium]|nr:ankyrin repeat domain-containing protein [Leptospiraceae bacterium]
FCYAASFQETDPKGLPDGSLYHIVGLAYDSGRWELYSDFHLRDPDQHSSSLGFRLVRVVQGSNTDTTNPNDPDEDVSRPDQINPAYNLPMIKAARAGNTRAVRDYLAKGADPNADFKGWTALMYAAYYGHLDMVKTLIAYKADASRKAGSWDATALAQHSNHAQIVLLLERYTGVRAIRQRGQPAVPR